MRSLLRKRQILETCIEAQRFRGACFRSARFSQPEFTAPSNGTGPRPSSKRTCPARPRRSAAPRPSADFKRPPRTATHLPAGVHSSATPPAPASPATDVAPPLSPSPSHTAILSAVSRGRGTWARSKARGPCSFADRMAWWGRGGRVPREPQVRLNGENVSKGLRQQSGPVCSGAAARRGGRSCGSRRMLR